MLDLVSLAFFTLSSTIYFMPSFDLSEKSCSTWLFKSFTQFSCPLSPEKLLFLSEIYCSRWLQGSSWLWTKPLRCYFLVGWVWLMFSILISCYCFMFTSSATFSSKIAFAYSSWRCLKLPLISFILLKYSTVIAHLANDLLVPMFFLQSLFISSSW